MKFKFKKIISEIYTNVAHIKIFWSCVFYRPDKIINKILPCHNCKCRILTMLKNSTKVELDFFHY